MKESRGTIRGLVLFAGLTALAPSLAGYWTNLTAETWYPTIAKPAWTPSSSLFGPVWTFLYAAMTVAVWRVWKKAGWAGARAALSLYFIQLILNVLWPGLFFAWQNPAWAAVEIIFLWLAVLATLLAFWPIDRFASALFIPYLLWVGFAAALNVAIWRMNP